MESSNPWGAVNPNILISTLGSPTDGINALQQAQAQTAARSAAVYQAQRERQQQALGDAALNDALANPTPQALIKLSIARPELWQSAKAANDALDSDTQTQQVQDLSGVYGTLKAGQPTDAQAMLQTRIDAAKRAGKDTQKYQVLHDLIGQDPTRAQVLTGTMLAGLAGPQQFAEAFGKLGDADRAQAGFATAQKQAQATLDKTRAETDKLVNPPPKTASAGIGPDGKPIFYNENAAPPAGGGAPASTNSGALDTFVQQLQASENSTGNPAAKNPNSSATGNGQFIDKTWLDMVGKYRPDLAQGKTPPQVLALRSDPTLSAQMVGAYAQDNAAALQASNLPVNSATLAMAHKLGAGGAQAVLNAAPDAKLSSVLPTEVIKANPQLANQTAGQYALGLKDKFGATPIDATPGDPNATGDDFLKTLPPARARMIQAIARGDLAMPPAVGRNAQQSQLMLQQVQQYDPTATAINLPVRKATQEAFTKGQQGQTINSLNTFAGHADKLNDAISQLDNTPIGVWNAVAQGTGQAVGNAKTQKAVANFNTWKGLASNEIVKVLRGTGGAEADIKYWQSQLDSAKSPVALHQVVQTMAQAVQSRLDSLQNEYNTGMATLGKPVPQVMPSTLATLNRLAAGGDKQAPNAPAQKVAVNPQTGQRLVQDASGHWGPG